jgi:serine/threonine-protein kinase
MAVVPRIGTEFAGYRIEALLGRGGMSVVYRAENARLGNKMALKLLAEDLANDESFRERFVRESRTAASLNHPNIVTIYDAGDEHGVLYIAMRYVEGDLKQLLVREGPLSIANTLAITAQIGSALDAAHARGLLHRDVKPANILLDAASEPAGAPHAYLADFGLTKHMESRSGITASGQFVGTIDYMSPEQIEGRDVDGRTDIYSLGCVLFECLTGITPFRRETQVAVLWAHMREDPPPVTDLRPELPGAVDLVVARATAKDPDNRYSSAQELMTDLRKALEGAPEALTRAARADDAPVRAAAPALADTKDGHRAPSRHRRWPVPVAALAAAALGAVGGIVGYELIRDVEPRIIGPGNTQLTADEQILARAIPFDQSLCEKTDPPTPEFVAGFICEPGDDRVDRVYYYLPVSASRMGPYSQDVAEGQGLNADGGQLLPEGSCSTPPAVNDWRRRGTIGHRWLRPDEQDGNGRAICYRRSGWAVMDWTDRDADVYSVAFGRDMIRLRQWWEAKAGPEPPG